MFDSEILEVAIGVVFVFVLVSTLASAIREGIEAWLKTRASYLEFGIRELLQDREGTGLCSELFKHPLIQNLFNGEYRPRPASKTPPKSGGRLPSYIPSRNFAMALMDIAARGPQNVGDEARSLSVAELRAAIASRTDLPISGALLAAIDAAGNDLELARLNIESWYDSTMDRVSGWYKRSTQWFIFWISLGTAMALNIDVLEIIDHLYSNDTQRTALVATIEMTTTAPADYETAKKELLALKLPLGWTERPLPHSFLEWLVRLCGWLIVAIAATLGAPFWFDVLNKIMVIRSTVKPREKSREEASEDRQLTQTPARPVVQTPAAPAAAAGTATVTPATAAAATGSVDTVCEIGDDDPTPDDALPPADGGVQK
jgi:hypothetical protein